MLALMRSGCARFGSVRLRSVDSDRVAGVRTARKLDAEARSAAAARLGVGVGDLERRSAEILDEIHGRTPDEIEAHRVDNQLDAVRLGNRVVRVGPVGQLEL